MVRSFILDQLEGESQEKTLHVKERRKLHEREQLHPQQSYNQRLLRLVWRTNLMNEAAQGMRRSHVSCGFVGAGHVAKP